MANRFSSSSNSGNAGKGSWLLAEELFEAGDSRFVDEIVRIDEAERLGAFAKKWYGDHRIEARQLLKEYLLRPLAHFRHEALVKRLFKLASAAGDDEVMGWFMVTLDRTVRREVITKHRYSWRTREQWTEQIVRIVPNTELGKQRDPRQTPQFRVLTPEQRERVDRWRDNVRLFSVDTRNYLRRRVWRYFRETGKKEPQRYVQSIARALPLYTNSDFPDGLALIDHWSLMHILFHDSPVLEARASGWVLRPSASLSDLRPAAAFQSQWIATPDALLTVLNQTKARPVKQWCLRLLRDHCSEFMQSLPLATVLEWLGDEDVELAEFAAELLKTSEGIEKLPPDDWYRLLKNSNADALPKLCELAAKCLSADSLSMDQLLSLAVSKTSAIVQLSLTWLRQRKLSDEERAKSLVLIDAQCEAHRESLLEWMVATLRGGAGDHAGRLLELLDAGREDVRKAAWIWFVEDESLRQNVQLWQQLMESPYGDVRLGLVEQLRRNELPVSDVQRRVVGSEQLDASLLRVLWSSTLLQIDRGGKHKPSVVKALASRIERRPSECDALLPILSIAVRSVRAVEFRAGLAALVQLMESRPELSERIEKSFPELELVQR